MKKLKITFTVMTLVLCTNLSMAQNANQKVTSGQKAESQTKHLSEKLSLTSEQKEQIHRINFEIMEKNDAVRKDNSLSEEAKKESLRKNNDARKQMIKPLLNPEQLTRFEEMEAKREKQMQSTPQGGRKTQPREIKPIEEKQLKTN